MRALLLALFVVTVPVSAAAQGEEADPDAAQGEAPLAAPTSGHASLHSGRTLGTGEVIVGGGAGWPSVYAQVEIGLSNVFNLGIRVAIHYGSTLMQFEPSVGGEVAVPLRFHILGEDEIDLSVFATPAATFGEGASVGEGGSIYATSFGYSVRGEAGIVAGWRPVDAITLIFGGGGHFGFVHTPDAGGPETIGAVFVRLGIEGLISRDTMLFAHTDAGVGFASSRGVGNPVFRGPVSPLFRLWFGAAYLL